MDRFLDSANPDKKARSKDIMSELSKCHDRIHLLKTGQVRDPVSFLNRRTHPSVHPLTFQKTT